MNETSPVIQYFLSSQFFLSLLIAVAVIPLLRRPALKFSFVDNPKGRKRHKEPVPLTGGPAIFLAAAVSLNIWGIPADYIGMLWAASGLFLLGVLDDKYDISAKFRLVIQASLVTVALWWDNNWISEIAFTSEFTLYFGDLKYLISVFAVMGVMNAINMLDGLDGLSSGVVLIILGFLIAIAVSANQFSSALVGICIFGGLLGFWAYNYRFEWREKASVFLGDSGTTVLGFILPIIAIKLSNVAPGHAPKSILLWLFAIPAWDICAVVIKRIRDGHSPIQARRDHIHHVLLNTGLSVRHSLHLIYLLTIATLSFGVAIQYFSFSKVESYFAFAVFTFIYLDRVGSLTVNPEKISDTNKNEVKVIPLKPKIKNSKK